MEEENKIERREWEFFWNGIRLFCSRVEFCLESLPAYTICECVNVFTFNVNKLAIWGLKRDFVCQEWNEQRNHTHTHTHSQYKWIEETNRKQSVQREMRRKTMCGWCYSFVNSLVQTIGVCNDLSMGLLCMKWRHRHQHTMVVHVVAPGTSEKSTSCKSDVRRERLQLQRRLKFE